MIKRDIARTFPDHSFFKDKDGIGQGTLYNVIKVNMCVNTICLKFMPDQLNIFSSSATYFQPNMSNVNMRLVLPNYNMCY